MRYPFFIIISLFILGLNTVQAQKTIVEDLQSNSNPSEGTIHIECDPAITALLGTPGSHSSTSSGTSDFVERPGYRIQVFMGNDPGTARSDAFSRQASIRNAFPDIATYLSYEAPNWKLMAGDFLTREEATVFKQQLQKEFPYLGKEMYIVVDKIKFPVEKNN
jgi:hypothetical protein